LPESFTHECGSRSPGRTRPRVLGAQDASPAVEVGPGSPH
jgi:hypothetical protein